MPGKDHGPVLKAVSPSSKAKFETMARALGKGLTALGKEKERPITGRGQVAKASLINTKDK